MSGNEKPIERRADILLVDDEPANLLALRAILEGMGDRLVEASSGEEALRHILEQDFAVILLDVQMRGMDGLEVAELIRRCRRSQDTPIIFVTAFDSQHDDLVRAYSLGAVDYLIKPLVPAILRAKVGFFIELFRKTERIRQLERDKYLAESEQRMGAVLDAALDCVISIDGDGNIVAWNPAAEATFGYRREQALGQNMAELIIPPEMRAAHQAGIARYLATGDGPLLAQRVEMVAMRASGETFPAELAIVAIPSGGGPLFTGYLRDITDRKRAENELRASQQRFQSFMQRSPAAAYIKDAEGRYVFVNRLLEEHFERPLADWLGRTDFDIFPAGDARQYRQNDQQVLASSESAQFVETAVRPDGPRYYLSFKFPLEDERGARLLAGMSLDITLQRQAQESLRESEARFRQLADAMPQIVYVNGPGGKVEYLNQRWREFTGLDTPDDLAALIHPEDLGEVIGRYRDAEERRADFECEFRLRRRDGEYRWYLTRAVPVVDGESRVVKWYGTSTDIDDTKRAEQTATFLADTSATLAELSDPDSTLKKVAGLAVPHFADWCTVDMLQPDGSLRRLAAAHIDPAKMELADELHRRYPPDPAAPRGVWNIARTGQSEIVSEITEELLEASTADAEVLRIVRELGLKSYIGVPLAARGKTLGVITFIAAESGRRYGPADLAVAEDLARRAAVAIENAYLYGALREEDRRKDEFLATLAHELRNPLAPLRNGLQVMKLLGHEPETTEQVREMMERQVEHLVRLVDDLLDVSRVSRGKIELRKERIALSTAIVSALETCESSIKQHGHELTVALPAEPIYVDADKTRLAQAICNVLHNAAKYTDPGGKISLSVERQIEEAVVRIRDSGVGIPAAMLPKIFDLFTQVDRSLEKSQGGLGIGLTLVRRLVELHGGRVEAHSAGPGLGSEFVIRLPVARAAIQGAACNADVEAPVRSIVARRILVVDDNTDAADSLAIMLRILGHEARTAHDGLEAVATAADFRPDMIFLDIGMPRLNGYDACRRIREHAWGRNPFIVALTGWGQEEDKRRSEEAGFDSHLVKPVAPAALNELLATLDVQRQRRESSRVLSAWPREE
jgi:PAS domain S-box-containing protein